MLSVTDELLMYINVRSYHYILLIIDVYNGRVEVMDSLAKPEEKYKSIIDAFQKKFQSLSHYISVSFVHFRNAGRRHGPGHEAEATHVCSRRRVRPEPLDPHGGAYNRPRQIGRAHV